MSEGYMDSAREAAARLFSFKRKEAGELISLPETSAERVQALVEMNTTQLDALRAEGKKGRLTTEEINDALTVLHGATEKAYQAGAEADSASTERAGILTQMLRDRGERYAPTKNPRAEFGSAEPLN